MKEADQRTSESIFDQDDPLPVKLNEVTEETEELASALGRDFARPGAPKPWVPGRSTAFGCAIGSLAFPFGIILLPVGLFSGATAMRRCRRSPDRYRGEGLVRIGLTLCAVELVGYIVILLCLAESFLL